MKTSWQENTEIVESLGSENVVVHDMPPLYHSRASNLRQEEIYLQQ